jgi:hypothetical protein
LESRINRSNKTWWQVHLLDSDVVCEELRNARVAHDKEHCACHDDLRFEPVVIILGQWIQSLEHEKLAFDMYVILRSA